jgi:hypothetical protein
MILPPAPPVAIMSGLMFEFAEVEVSPDSSESAFKFKVRVYMENFSAETIRLGAPTWEDGVAPQGGYLTYSYQLRQSNNSQKPWGDELKDVKVSAGRRVRMWLGLDPARRDAALQLLDNAQLGLLTIPVTVLGRVINVRMRPSDRGLRRVAAKEYDSIKEALADIYATQSQTAKAALGFVKARRLVSLTDIEEHFQQYHLANPLNVNTALSQELIRFVTLTKDGHVVLNPVLEKIIIETITTDEADFQSRSKSPRMRRYKKGSAKNLDLKDGGMR